jgi:hypothetical protein
LHKAFGPLLTLVAVAALGSGIWLMNVGQEASTAASTAPVAQTATTAVRVPHHPPRRW